MYPLAADQGDARAQASLGRMYAKGQGVPQDYSKAINWARLAADQGNAFVGATSSPSRPARRSPI